MDIEEISNRRRREKGVLVYPVFSRRAGGLSVGINLFPDKKNCSYDCPYCEVFPFSGSAEFSLEQLEQDLRAVIASMLKQNMPVKDICFSGNGEPTLSAFFHDALLRAEAVRAEMVSSAELVVITNGAGLLKQQIFSLLCEAAANPYLNIWLKLDAGTDIWYKKINRSSLPFDKLLEKKKEFISRTGSFAGNCTPVTIQTMLCAIDGEQPPKQEEQVWEELVCNLALASGTNCNIRKVQLYGKARAAPQDPSACELPAQYLEKRAASLRHAFEIKNIPAPVEIYL